MQMPIEPSRPVQDGMRLQEGDHRARIGIVGGERLVHLAPVAAVGPRAVVRQRRPGGLKLVEDLRHRHDVPVPGEQRGGAPDRARGLEDLRKKDEPGYRPSRRGTQTKVRIGPLGVSRSANSWSMIVMAHPFRDPAVKRCGARRRSVAARL